MTLLPTLVLKLGYATGVSAEALQGLTQLSRTFDEALNRTPDRHRPYVGAAAFAHKAGLHASAVLRDPSYYEHIDPALVGNQRDILVSDQAGRANLLARLREMGLTVEPHPEATGALLAELKAREAQGFAYEGASASFELLVRRTLDRVLLVVAAVTPFSVERASYQVTVEALLGGDPWGPGVRSPVPQ